MMIMASKSEKIFLTISLSLSQFHRYSDLESRMKDELMNVKIKFTEQSQTVAELKQKISALETKVRLS